MQILMQIVDVVPILQKDIMEAFSGGFHDFEDAVQAACAARIEADHIITLNIKDFKNSAVSAILPCDFLNMLC